MSAHSASDENVTTPFDPDTCGFPVFATQGGGFARQEGGPDLNLYVFVEAPADVPGLNVGDRVPEEWGIVPVNVAARRLDDVTSLDDLDLDPAGLPGYM